MVYSSNILQIIHYGQMESKHVISRLEVNSIGELKSCNHVMHSIWIPVDLEPLQIDGTWTTGHKITFRNQSQDWPILLHHCHHLLDHGIPTH